ncbi:MAG TPA: response regulator [Deltaproteobacteria bacterium]|jgi:two-component system response regulator BaeR|nr:response regulator [Deltaproteobacteria bacterium]HQI02800.1 response regulator [Deltaproteobacteria bacterium]HQJ08812.1 response regulator [Deltaproteobacteria bacterium]
MNSKHILIVEDEDKIAALLKDYLEAQGCSVSRLNRGDEVVSFLKQKLPDLILLDIMLPGMDGMDVCRDIRKFSTVPIIMITARVEEIDRLLGLELGADDYVCKPFSPREVVARVKAVLRRAQPAVKDVVLKAGSIVLHEDTRNVTIGGRELRLTPNEFGLLRLLMANPGRVFSRGELVSRVQGYDYEGYDRTVDTHIKNLRRKISALLPGKEIISSIYGVGYRLNEP